MFVLEFCFVKVHLIAYLTKALDYLKFLALTLSFLEVVMWRLEIEKYFDFKYTNYCRCTYLDDTLMYNSTHVQKLK